MVLTFTFCFLLILSVFSQVVMTQYEKEEVSLKLAHFKGIGPSQKKPSLIFEAKKKKPSRLKSKPTSKPIAPKIRHRGGLNFYLLLHEKPSPLEDELFIKLFERLYFRANFFEPGLASLFLKALKEAASTKKAIKSLNDIASLDLQDPKLQKIHYLVLKGCEGVDQNGGFSSLLNYLHFEASSLTRMNLYELDEIWLSILFDERTAQYIQENRNEELNLEKIKAFYGQSPYRFEALVSCHPPSKRTKTLTH